MLKYNGLRKRQTYDELIDYLLNKQETIKYPSRIKLYPRSILDDLYDIKASKILHKENKETQTEVLMSDKAIQTDLSHKGVQVNVKLNPTEYQHWLKAYDGEEVINYRYWLNWYIKDKATQTSKFSIINRKDYEYPVFTPPSTPAREKRKPPLNVNMATQIANTTTTFVNFGSTAIGNYLTNQNPTSPLHFSNINSPSSSATSVIASSRPVTVNSSRPVTVASSRPVSVQSSPHHPVSPYSPSYLPMPYEEDSPASSSSSKSK
jgi:hypothetical protein